MAKGLVKDSTLTAIANAIREKTETTGTMLPSEMAAMIQGLSSMKVTYGSKTGSSASNSLTIEHGLGETPNLFLLTYTYSAYMNTVTAISGILLPNNTGGLYYYESSRSSIWSMTFDDTNISELVPVIDGTKITMQMPGNRYFGGTYSWVAGVV